MKPYKLNNFLILLITLALFTVSILLLYFLVELDITAYIMLGLMLLIAIVCIYTSMIKGLLLTFVITLGYGVTVIVSGTTDLLPAIDMSYYFLTFPTLVALMFGCVNIMNRKVMHVSQSFEAQYDALIRIDALTGFRNAKDYFENLEHEIHRKERYGHELSLMLIHIESFNELNKLYGEYQGNRFLKYLSEFVIDLTRNVDRHYRVDDQLIGIILPNTGAEGSKILKQRFVDELESLSIVVKGDHQRIDINIDIVYEVYDQLKTTKQFHNSTLDQLAIKNRGVSR